MGAEEVGWSSNLDLTVGLLPTTGFLPIVGTGLMPRVLFVVVVVVVTGVDEIGCFGFEVEALIPRSGVVVEGVRLPLTVG